jgi:hypothetical protein
VIVGLLKPGDMIVTTSHIVMENMNFPLYGAPTLGGHRIASAGSSTGPTHLYALLVGVYVLRPRYTGHSDAIYVVLTPTGLGYAWSAGWVRVA